MRRALAIELVGAAAGGSMGALLRYGVLTRWPAPHDVLITTVVGTALAMAVCGAVVAARAAGVVFAVALSACGTATSLSALGVIAAGRTPWLALAFVALTPIAAILGFIAGWSARRAVAAR